MVYLHYKTHNKALNTDSAKNASRITLALLTTKHHPKTFQPTLPPALSGTNTSPAQA
jgi:hypothetical protein